MQALDILVVTAAVTVADITVVGITADIMAGIMAGIMVTMVDMAGIMILLLALRINLRYRL
jgi:hypothetical protein